MQTQATTGRLEWGLIIQCLLLCLMVLFFDISMPLGVAGAVPYVIPILLSLRGGARYPLAFALLCSLLTLIGYLYSKPMGIAWMVLVNRGLALLVIWSTALLALRMLNYQRRMLRSESQFRLLAEQAQVLIWRADAHGKWEFSSNGWRALTGLDADALHGDGWQRVIHPAERQRVVGCYKKAVSESGNFDARCRVIKANGDYAWLAMHSAAWASSSTESFTGMLGVALDVSEQVEVKRQLMQALQRIGHQEKMAMIGTLVGGILHEIGNPAASISGLVQQALAECDCEADQARQSEDFCQVLRQIQEQVQRISQSSREIMDFTALQSDTVEYHDINLLVSRLVRLVRHDERLRGIRFDTELDQTIPAVEVVAERVVQLLMNLLENAIEACRGIPGSAIVLITRLHEDQVELIVRDTGLGMDAERLSLLEHETVAETSGDGRAFGLALCHEIAREYGGGLVLRTLEGGGTEARVSLDCIARGD